VLAPNVYGKFSGTHEVTAKCEMLDVLFSWTHKTYSAR
jgi:hypothetical protein